MQTITGFFLSALHAITPAVSKPADVPDYMHTLPPGCLPYAEFSQKFSLGETTTEKSNPITQKLSQTLENDVVSGLKLLCEVDEKVIGGLEQFASTIDMWAPIIAKKIQSKGRVFLIGSGSSGRVGVDIAAKCRQAFPEFKNSIRGVIAGGESALIRAKEGFEDSEADGVKALKDLNIGPNDSVILISASGSASFNVGCGHFAANQGAATYYFYNSKEIPDRTQRLFQRVNNPVVALELDIGPQAINGSTRLQGATLAEACLGALLGSSLYHVQGKDTLGKAYASALAADMKTGLAAIRKHLGCMARFIRKEAEVFSHPDANFRKLRDESERGYVTFVGKANSMREILIDATETPPTFSTNPIRREGDTTKRPEFSAYLVGEKDSQAAWTALLGKDVNTADLNDTAKFVLAAGAEGQNSYEKRPKGNGNFIIGVAKLGAAEEIPSDLLDALNAAKAKGADTGVILVCNGTLSESSRKALKETNAMTVVLDKIPHDALGSIETIVLKQTLNLISNGSMILMKKVHGNQMVDVRASNMKLVDRCIRLIKDIWSGYGFTLSISDEVLYRYVCHVNALKKAYEQKESVQVSSVVKIVLAMLYANKTPTPENFKDVVTLLSDKKDNLDKVITDGTLCIDGGGSKTLLQFLDANGKLVPLIKDGIESESIIGGGSNINIIGIEGVRKTLHALFDNVKVKGQTKDLKETIARCRIVAGMAGVALPTNKAQVTSVFKEMGISEDRLNLMTDADLAMNLLPEKGISLLAGTGSICFGKNGSAVHRVGGLGTVLGDEGSAYHIGIEAIKAVIAEEYGWGDRTSLREALKKHFELTELKYLIPKVNAREISPGQIAKLAPLVFDEAAKNDAVATAIINTAAKALNEMVRNMLKISNLANCELQLWGGVFKNAHAAAFIEKINDSALKERSIKIVNRAHENGALELARKR